MRPARVVPVVLLAFLGLVAAVPADAAQIVTRNPRGVRLAVDNKHRAMVTYYHGGRWWHDFFWGAINARTPSQDMKQVKFRVDYSGGRGAWRHFKNTCRPYDGPALAWLVTACTARDGSYWALQSWQRMLPNVGYVPWKHEQRVWELRLSHWTGLPAQIEVYTDWVYAGRFHALFGRATYRGQPIYGFKTTASGNPLDAFGRLVFLDTFDSAYGPGWRRENSFVVHKPSGMFCYGFFPHSSYGDYPKQRTQKLAGNGRRYRITLSGPGVTPDVTWTGAGLPDYDPKNPQLLDLQNQMREKVRSMARAYGDRLCGHH